MEMGINEWWNNPCVTEPVARTSTVMMPFEEWNVLPLLHRANNLQQRAKGTKEAWATRIFGKPFDTLYTDVDGYDWLPTVPSIPDSGDKLKFDHVKPEYLIVQLYHDFLLYSAAITFLAHEEPALPGQIFQVIQFELEVFLCTFYKLLRNANVIFPNKVYASIIPKEFEGAKLDEDQRHKRKFIIYREYMKGLDYLIRALEYIDDIQGITMHRKLLRLQN